MGKVSKIGGGPIGGESWIVPSGMVLRFPDGSASSPSLTFTVDTNTGLYRIGSDNIGVSTGGTLRFDVSTTAVTSTLAIVLPVGAVGTPSLTFTGDTTSGLYRIGANNVGVALNGALEYDLSTTVLNLKGNALSGDSA